MTVRALERAEQQPKKKSFLAFMNSRVKAAFFFARFLNFIVTFFFELLLWALQGSDGHLNVCDLERNPNWPIAKLFK